jgi:hypothetical protein
MAGQKETPVGQESRQRGRQRVKSGPLCEILSRQGVEGKAAVDLLVQTCQVSAWTASQMLAGEVLVIARHAAMLRMFLSTVELRELCAKQGGDGLADLLDVMRAGDDLETSFVEVDELTDADLAFVMDV